MHGYSSRLRRERRKVSNLHQFKSYAGAFFAEVLCDPLFGVPGQTGPAPEVGTLSRTADNIVEGGNKHVFNRFIGEALAGVAVSRGHNLLSENAISNNLMDQS